MNKVFNLVRQLTDTVGTGTITLGAATAEFRTFDTGGAVDGDICTYGIQDAVTGDRAIEWGVYDSAGPTLTRGGTYPTGTAVLSLSGDAEIISTPAAEDLGEVVEPLTLTQVLTSNYILATVLNATIENGGTGGTPGPAVVVGTTGTGTMVEVDVTIEAGGQIESIDGISVAGLYTVLPTDPGYEPVVGGGLTDAVLRLYMSFAPSVVGSDPTSGFGFGLQGVPLITLEGIVAAYLSSSVAAYGYSAGLDNIGTNLLMLGPFAGQDNTGNNSTFIGLQAGQRNSGNVVVAIGVDAGVDNTGSNLTALGNSAGEANTGTGVLGLGVQAAKSNSGNNVIAIGDISCDSNTGDNVIAIGVGILAGNSLSNVISIGDVIIATGTDVPVTSVVELSGNLTVAGQLIGGGTPTDDDAAAGKIGEYLESSATGVSLTTATQTNITSQALSAGDWDVEGVIEFDAGASTVVAYVSAGISTVSATLSAGGIVGRAGFVPPATAGSDVILPTGRKRIKSDGTAVAYLVGYSSHTVSTMTAAGQIVARRVR